MDVGIVAGNDAVAQVRRRTEPPDLILPEHHGLRLEHVCGPKLPAHLVPWDRERQQTVASGELRDAVSRAFRQPPMEAGLLVAWP